MKKWSSYWGELFISLILYNIQYLTVSKDVNENYSTIIEKKSVYKFNCKCLRVLLRSVPIIHYFHHLIKPLFIKTWWRFISYIMLALVLSYFIHNH